MPVATDELNADIKQLSRDLASFREDVIREIASVRGSTASEVAAARDSTIKAVGDLRAEFTEFRGEMRTATRFIGVVGSICATAGIGLVVAAFGFAVQVGDFKARLVAVEKDTQEIADVVRESNRKKTGEIRVEPLSPAIEPPFRGAKKAP